MLYRSIIYSRYHIGIVYAKCCCIPVGEINTENKEKERGPINQMKLYNRYE